VYYILVTADGVKIKTQEGTYSKGYLAEAFEMSLAPLSPITVESLDDIETIIEGLSGTEKGYKFKLTDEEYNKIFFGKVRQGYNTYKKGMLVEYFAIRQEMVNAGQEAKRASRKAYYKTNRTLVGFL
jgi:hypothetical protein